MSQRNKIALFVVIAVLAVAALVVGTGLLRPQTPVAGDTALISPAQYQDQFMTAAQSHLLLDVRTPEEFSSGHIPGAVNIPVEELQSRLSEVSGDAAVVVYCRTGRRSAQAAQILNGAGYTSVYDLGGIQTWQAQGLPVE